MSHRVIAGSAKGRRLQLVPGDTTRPIGDRAKESLFNIIGQEIIDARFLDLFGGTGAVGIEALSRGARFALFCELAGVAVKTISTNLKITGLADNAQIRRTDAIAMLRETPPAEPFDYIFVAPPQYKGLWLEVLKTLDANADWVPQGTTVIVQIDPKEYTDARFHHLSLVDERTYGKTMLGFYVRREGR
jgi:16S rRNA (guanine(966)-N(2))-methyltransferase RsmD